MRLVCVVVGIVAATAMGVQAQQGGVKLGPPATSVQVGGVCPGVLSAKQQPNAEIWTIAREDRGKQNQTDVAHGMGVHVEFENASTPLRALELRVSYLPERLRFMRVDPKFMPGSPKQDTHDSTKMFDLGGQNTMLMEGNLMVGRASMIKRVTLMSATFADGHVWHAASEEECSVAPSLYMPVEAKK